MPSFIYASEILEYNENELQQLQTLDNNVYRAILEMPAYTACSALRAEIGASSSKAGDIKNKLLFIKHILEENGNYLVRDIFLKQYYEKETKYIKRIKQYMKMININLDAIKRAPIKKIKEMVNEWDINYWKEEMKGKATLRIYSKYKENTKEISWHENSAKTEILIKACTDTLKLNWREKYKGKDNKLYLWM